MVGKTHRHLQDHPPRNIQAGPSRHAPPVTRGPRASMPSIVQRRAAAGFDIIRELSTTPVKLDWSSLLKVSPDLREDMKYFLKESDGQPGPSGPPPQIPSRPVKPMVPSRPPKAQQHGPTPMKTVLLHNAETMQVAAFLASSTQWRKPEQLSSGFHLRPS